MSENGRFEEVVLPHLDAAYNLARWLTHNPDDARDVVQEALIRALKYFSSYRGGDSRSWFLVIVRNASYTWLERRKSTEHKPLEEDFTAAVDESANPESTMERSTHRRRIQEAVHALPMEYREVIILREMEGLSYKEISDVAGVPVGTVMSRLSRGRARLQEILAELRHTT